ncbi:MarR family transcriptional regulator [Nocardia otitidiscaviarum]|uniref:MarR family transcriptional regulator n=1 Tax=Nocardia otitidiscaviarum TaxID=1823 RepID=UPI0004A75C18|nr:MarR family transcriptional regulator [Nocardia otitidiscaviarum]
MNTTEARVLATLAPGGQLSAAQIADSADITTRAARRAIDRLARLGLIVTGVGIWRDAWTLTRRGRAYIETPIGRAYIDVPAGV